MRGEGLSRGNSSRHAESSTLASDSLTQAGAINYVPSAASARSQHMSHHFTNGSRNCFVAPRGLSPVAAQAAKLLATLWSAPASHRDIGCPSEPLPDLVGC